MDFSGTAQEQNGDLQNKRICEWKHRSQTHSFNVEYIYILAVFWYTTTNGRVGPKVDSEFNFYNKVKF